MSRFIFESVWLWVCLMSIGWGVAAIKEIISLESEIKEEKRCLKERVLIWRTFVEETDRLLASAKADGVEKRVEIWTAFNSLARNQLMKARFEEGLTK